MKNPHYFPEMDALKGVPFHTHDDSGSTPPAEVITGTNRQVAIFDTDDDTPGALKAGAFRPNHWSEINKGAPVESGTWLAAYTNNPIDPSQDMFFIKNTYIPEVGTIPLYDINGELFVNTGTDANHAVNRKDLQDAVDAINSGSVTPDTISDIESTLEIKVDKQIGMGLSETSFTQAEKNKLSTIVEHYAGRFLSLTDLNAITGVPGGYAYVSIDSAPTVLYAWNNQTSTWDSTVLAVSEESPETIKTKYEANADTNTFTNAYKTKIDGIAVQATKNQTDAYLLSLANQTGTLPISKVTDLTTIITAINATNDSQTAAIQSKADFPTTNQHVPIRTSAGAQSSFPFATPATPSTFVFRDSNGRFASAAPVSANDVVNKTYADKAGLISKTTSSEMTIREFTDRFEYTSKNVINSLSIPAVGTAHPLASYLPTGVTIAGCDELSCTPYSASTGRYIYTTVRDGPDRRLVVEFGNLTSASITWSGTMFIKLVKYK